MDYRPHARRIAQAILEITKFADEYRMQPVPDLPDSVVNAAEELCLELETFINAVINENNREW